MGCGNSKPKIENPPQKESSTADVDDKTSTNVTEMDIDDSHEGAIDFAAMDDKEDALDKEGNGMVDPYKEVSTLFDPLTEEELALEKKQQEQ